MKPLVVDDLVSRALDNLELSDERTPAFTLILGSGFSWPVLPTARDMVEHDIGWWLYHRRKKCTFDFRTLHDAAAMGIDREDVRQFSRKVWRDIQADVAARTPEDAFDLTPDGDVRTDTHLNVSRAYTAAMSGASNHGLHDDSLRRRFLLDVVRRVQRRVNRAHIALAGILEHQNDNPKQRPFCRTIFTTNFDPLLQRSLQLVNVLYHVSDRPEQLPKPATAETTDTVHLMYAHGSVFRNWVLNSNDEIAAGRTQNTEAIREYLEGRNVIVMGYSGWDDALMRALLDRKGAGTLYWCDRLKPEEAKSALRPDVLTLLKRPNTYYVPITGADEAMTALHARITQRSFPRFVTSPIETMISGLQNIVIPQGSEELPEQWGTMIRFAVKRLEASLREWNEAATLPAKTAADALVAQREGDRETAIRHWTAFVTDPTISEADRKTALINRAVAYREDRRYDEALADYATLLGMKLSEEEKARVLSNRATALTYAGRWEEAIAACTEVIELESVPPSTRARALGNRGWAYYSVGNVTEAREDSIRAVRIDPKLTPVRFNYALASLVVGELDDAWEYYRWGAMDAPNGQDLQQYGIADLEETLKKRIADPVVLAEGKKILAMLRERQKKLR